MILQPRRDIYVVANAKIKFFTNEAKKSENNSKAPL